MINIFNSKVLKVEDLTAETKLIRLSVPENFKFKAGQYLSLTVFHNGRKIRRPFSISNPPKENNKFIELCIKIIPNGLASEFIKSLKEGDEVELFGPAGKFIVDNLDRNLIFIASGVGIAPFMSIIPDLLNKNFDKKIILIKSARTEKDSLYEKELSKLMKSHDNFIFYNVFSNPVDNKLNKGYVQDFIDKYISKDFNGNFYISGLKEMIKDVKEKLLSMGFSEDQIFYEKFN